MQFLFSDCILFHYFSSDEIDVTQLLKEMDKCSGDSAHSRLLLKNTYNERRAVIVNADTCGEVVDKFPLMKNLALVSKALSRFMSTVGYFLGLDLPQKLSVGPVPTLTHTRIFFPLCISVLTISIVHELV